MKLYAPFTSHTAYVFQHTLRWIMLILQLSKLLKNLGVSSVIAFALLDQDTAVNFVTASCIA